MFERRHDFICMAFVFISLAIILAGLLNLTEEKSQQKLVTAAPVSKDSYFKGIDYYVVSDGSNSFYLSADEFLRNPVSGKNTFFVPRGRFYVPGGKEATFDAQRGVFTEENKKMFLEGNVSVRSGRALMGSEQIIYHIDGDQIEFKGNVESRVSDEKGNLVAISSLQAKSQPGKGENVYFGRVKGKVVRKRSYEEGIKFQADRMSFDTHKNNIMMNGDVTLTKQGLIVNGRRGEIFLQNYSKRLKYFALYDDVKVKEYVRRAGGKSHHRRAYAEKLEGIMAEDKIVLTGYPKVYQRQDVIKGNRITLRENNEVVEVDDASTDLTIK